LRISLRRAAKVTIRTAVPVGMRQRLAVWVGRQAWLSGREYLSMELVRDLAEKDPNRFHRFLWSNHLGYAETYEVERRFDEANLHPTRRLLLDELGSCLREQTREAVGEVKSVLDVGCSLGYLLHHLETSVFPDAEVLDGVDIDEYAIEAGAKHLARQGSRVRLQAGDMADLPRLLGDRRYDVVLSAGTLMYLTEADAAVVVRELLARTRGVLALTGLADPEADNAQLARSAVRERDGSFVHNLDRMVAAAGGRVVRRRWDGAHQIDGNTVYFVFAVPAPLGAVLG
jgi:SAM-dependent methyltransferase